MSETVLDHGYIPEEHAPDPVIGHGDPTAPGKIGIWLFLASEIMFFIGILGSYIVLRSGSSLLFAQHAEALSKKLAGLNTLVLIFSSLTMALSVDAAQKGNRKRVIGCLFLTFLCAAGFMVIKGIEYTDKAHHRTIVTAVRDKPSPLRVDAGAENARKRLYAVISAASGSTQLPFNGNKFVKKSEKDWGRYAIPLTETSRGIYTTEVPGAAAGVAGPAPVKIYEAKGDAATPKDTPLKLTRAGAIDWSAGMWVYDGHVRHDGHGYVCYEGYRMPMESEFDIHHISEKYIKEHGGEPVELKHGEEPKPENIIAGADITDQIVYGPWKNIFYASYFALTGVHGIHVLGGMIPISILLIQALRGKLFPPQTEYTGLYWHFVDLVWIFLFPLLYLI